MQAPKGPIALFGGGRWGAVLAGVLDDVLPSGARILWVSRHDRRNQERLISERHDGAGDRIEILDDPMAAFQEGATVALVATAPRTHGAITRLALERGLAVLVEKPFTLDAREAQALIALAEQRQAVLGVGLHLLVASHLRHFAALTAGRRVRSCHVRWFDPEFDSRYGTAKFADLSTHKVHDVFPHIWAILRVVVPGESVTVLDSEARPRGAVSAQLRCGETRVVAEFGRRAETRRRQVTLGFADGGSAELDFTSEPGSVTVDGRPQPSDPGWDASPRPLTAEITGFLGAIGDPAAAEAWPLHARRCLDSVTCAAQLARIQAEREASAIAARLAGGGAHADDADVSAWLIDNLAPERADFGERITVPDLEAQRTLVNRALRQLKRDASSCPEPNSAFLALVESGLGRNGKG